MAQLATAESRYGRILVDGSGRTVYLFDIERDPTPRCYDACAVSWPPLLATTASGHPLYYYVGDRNVGDIKCQAVIEFGGGWYVVDSRGNKITTR